MAARPELYVVTYHVNDDKWPEFEEWSNRMKTRMLSHPGHVTSMIHSADEGDDCAVSLVIMFDSKFSMESWKNDPDRLALLEEAATSGLFHFHTRGSVRTNTLFWGLWSPSDSDSDSQPQSKQPPKWKVYFVLLFALYPTLLFMTRIVVPVIKMVPVYPNMKLLLQAAGTMAIMNFIAVPLSFKLAAKMQFLAERSSWEVLSMISAYLLLMVAEGFFVQGLDIAFSRK